MMLAVNQMRFKVLAVVVALALVVPLVMMPVGAAQAQESVKETNTEVVLTGLLPEEAINAINSNGAEIEIMENGTPVMVVVVEKKIEDEVYEETYYIPLTLPSTLEVKNIADGSKITVEVDGNYLLIPYGEEIERVCISDFYVKEIKDDGQVVLVGEVNSVLATIALILASGVVGYVVGVFFDDIRNVESRDSRDEPISIWGKDGFATLEFDIQTPPTMLEKFIVAVKAFDVDEAWGETINVYFRTRDTILLLGTLNTGPSDTITWTTVSVLPHQLDTVYNTLMRNDGKFEIKFDRVTDGWARIDWFEITWYWH